MSKFSAEFNARLIAIMPATSFTNRNGETKYNQDFIFEPLEKNEYSQPLSVNVYDNKVDMNNFPIGTTCKIYLNLESRQYNDKNTGEVKYFTKIGMWKCEAMQQASGIPTAGAATATPPTPGAPSPSAQKVGAPAANFAGKQIQDKNDVYWHSDGQSWSKYDGAKWVIQAQGVGPELTPAAPPAAPAAPQDGDDLPF